MVSGRHTIHINLVSWKSSTFTSDKGVVVSGIVLSRRAWTAPMCLFMAFTLGHNTFGNDILYGGYVNIKGILGAWWD